MKKTVLFLAMTLMGLMLTANPVDPNRAAQVAKNFVAQHTKGANGLNATLVYTHPMPQSGRPAMYAYNVGNSAFVLVAADDIAHPVLGYNLGRPWPTVGAYPRVRPENGEQAAAALPSQVSGFLDDLAAQIESGTQTSPSAAPDRYIAAEWQQLLSSEFNIQNTQLNLPDSVGPLLTTTWDQGQYYNALCPEDTAGPAGHALTGCVATAMAQIINYWGYPIHGRGTHSYNQETNTFYGTLSVNYDSANYDYANMPSQLTALSNPAQINAVAQLMYHCGVAANMEYGPTESGAYNYDARAGMINYFYISPNASYVERAEFCNIEWEQLLQTNIVAGQPVYYIGNGSQVGHSFVCDGYKNNGYFHFNFGWGGLADGWYLNVAINPLGYSFNSFQAAIVGIIPDSNGSVIIGQMRGESKYVIEEPMEFYHLLGHNLYTGISYNNVFNSDVTFVSSDSSNQLTLDFISYEDQDATIFYGDESALRIITAGQTNDLNPIISTNDSIKITYAGSEYYSGFCIRIGQNNGCRIVSNILVAPNDTSVALSWTENGMASAWEIEYGVHGFTKGEGNTFVSITNNATINGLMKLTQYDVYITPDCTDSNSSAWNMVSFRTSAPYWQDIVVTQPADYTVNDNGIVEISSPEALAWWSKNGLWQNVILISDIDLSGYKWRPVNYINQFNGNNHVISNLYVDEYPNQDAGFFGEMFGEVRNLGITDFFVRGNIDVGGMCGRLQSGKLINCYVSRGTIEGNDQIGGLVGYSFENSYINCFVNAHVIGKAKNGILIGVGGSDTITNCYAAGNLRVSSYCFSAGLVALAASSVISNCYTMVTPGGIIGNSIYNSIVDTSTFSGYGTNWILTTPVSFDGVPMDDLCMVLNKGVANVNDSICKTWMSDTNNINNGYPIFGDFYEVTCPSVSNVIAKNIIVDSQSCVLLEWNGQNTSHWQIRYYRNDYPIDSAIIKTTFSNPDTLRNIPLGDVWSFNVRAVCDNSNSGWSRTVALTVDLPYWTDVVTEQPNGYYEDSLGNITITTAEGLAWLSVKSNGLQGEPVCLFEGKKIRIENDIDLAGYQWFPIVAKGDSWLGGFMGDLDGQGHVISNIYINNNKAIPIGLFGFCKESTFQNITITGQILNKSSAVTDIDASGGLVGCMGNGNIINCHSSVNVTAKDLVGSLCGHIYNPDVSGIVKNCSASGTVIGGSECGGLIGKTYGDINVVNCYATGDVLMLNEQRSYEYNGGLIGNFMSGSKARNCFSLGVVEARVYSAKVIGCPYIYPSIQYVYGLRDLELNVTGAAQINEISDTSSFYLENGVFLLTTPITIEDSNYNSLLDILNAYVRYMNDPSLFTWITDSVGGYPTFDGYFLPNCFNPQNIVISNTSGVGDSIVRTKIEWTQEGSPQEWEILYVQSGHSIDSGQIVVADSNSIVLTNIPTSIPLDFYVRAVCNSTSHSAWCGPITYIPDKKHWVEVVTSQPEGYSEDENGVIYITTAEGLAWLSSVVNGLNGEMANNSNLFIKLMSDIDMSIYRWTPLRNTYNVVFDGNGHKISGLYCNELSDMIGLFAGMNYGTVANLSINGIIYGLSYVGVVGGNLYESKILNCNVSGEVKGIQFVGGVAGFHNQGKIANCSYVGNLIVRRDVSEANAMIGYSGGIFGSAYFDTIINSYVSCNIPIEPYSGMITGTGHNANLISEVYYQDFSTGLMATGYGTSQNLTSFSGNDTIWTLNTPPYVNGEFRTDLLAALNAWVDANNTTGIYRHWAADSANVNGGFPVFAAIPCTTATGSDSITVCDSYTWHGTTYTTSNELIDTLSTNMGCDSIVTHYLIVNHPVHTATTQTACETYTWNGTDYTASGDYTYIHLDANSCTQVDTLHLTINNPIHTATTETACENYTWNGTAYTTSGDYNYTHLDNNGCTQVDTLHLTINQSTTGDTTATACDSFTWHGTTYTASGIFNSQFSILNSAGCDSTVTLHLTINNSTTGDTTATSCDSFTWHGTTYTAGGTPTYQTVNAAGCDSTVTLHLTINNSTTGDTTATACDSFTWHGTTYTASGTPTYQTVNAAGCDSTVTLHLTINNSTTGDTTATSCDSFNWHGTTYTAGGTPTYQTVNAAGCDSTVTLHLTINNSTTGDTTATSCDSFTWHGTTYTAGGTPTYQTVNTSGCDSTVTLHLTINYSTTGDTMATSCDSFTWQGTTYTSSGDVHGSTPLQNIAGCDSTVTLHLTINNSTAGDTTATACDSFTWHGTTYTAGGTPTYQTVNAAGCDSTVTLHLTINHSVYVTDSLIIGSDELPYDYHGNSITQEGEYTFTGVTTEGCDSTMYLMVIINQVGIFEIQNSEFEVQIYPNPTNGLLTVAAAGLERVEVMDIVGRELIAMDCRSDKVTVDLSKLPQGAYTLRIKSQNATFIKKVVKK